MDDPTEATRNRAKDAVAAEANAAGAEADDADAAP
jgi:hypothetical protein